MLENSTVILMAKKCLKKYRRAEECAEKTYGKMLETSRARNFARVLSDRIRAYFESSLVKKAVEIGEKEMVAVSDSSKVRRWAINLSLAAKAKAVKSFKESEIAALITKIKDALSADLVKKMSTIAVAAISVNMAISILLKKDIGVIGWITRSGLLFAGLALLFCRASRSEIQKTSFFFRLFVKRAR